MGKLSKRNAGYQALSLLQFLPKILYRNKVRILAYHAIPDAVAFDKQLEYLKNHYNIIGIEDLEDHIFNGKKLKPNALLISFDDGDYTNYTSGLPLLKKHGLPAVFFIITELIGTTKPFWWNLVQEYYNRRNEKHLGRKNINRLKRIPNKERIAFIESIEKDVTGFQQQQLSKTELKQLLQQNITIANHSDTHPMFDQLTDEEFGREIEQAGKFFKEEAINGFQWFAYPNGNANEQKEEYMKQHGIKLAFLFDHKINKKTINPLRISRIKVGTNVPLSEFKVKVSGLHSMMYK